MAFWDELCFGISKVPFSNRLEKCKTIALPMQQFYFIPAPRQENKTSPKRGSFLNSLRTKPLRQSYPLRISQLPA